MVIHHKTGPSEFRPHALARTGAGHIRSPGDRCGETVAARPPPSGLRRVT